MDFKLMVNNAAGWAKQNSPYIAFGAGMVSLGLTIYSSIKRTITLNDILDEYDTEMHALSEGQATTKEVRKTKFKYAGKIAVHYAPTFAFTAITVGSFGWCFGTLNSRLGTALGTLGSVTEAFDLYRQNVRDDLGEDADLKYYYGLKEETITVEEEDPETGKKKKHKEKVLTGEPNGMFAYRFKKYDYNDRSGSTQWDASATWDLGYLIGKRQEWQNKVDRGYKVTLDRVLDDLGFEERPEDKPEEHIAGWVPGDTILFGLDDETIKDVRDFISGASNEVTLRFNCRTDVFDKTKDQCIYSDSDNEGNKEMITEYIENDIKALEEVAE